MSDGKFESDLVDRIGDFYADPLGFVLFAFPWGESGGALEEFDGPDEWQRRLLLELGDCVRRGDDVRFSTASGHGVGKSTLVAWIVLWFISTRQSPQIVVTANTSEQLSSKTWRELAKWWKLGINSHWFSRTATKFYHKSHPEDWFASAVPWSAERPEAFAGTHERHVLIIFDEASAIDDVIWETAEGAMTTAGSMWLNFGNPTRNSGRFFECFHRFKHRWRTFKVDSREAKMADQNVIAQWVEDWGEDDDFVRVRVRGVFPRTSMTQFISTDSVMRGREYDAEPGIWEHMPVILGVDVGRFGGSKTVIAARQGRKCHRPQTYMQLDTMEVAARVVEAIGYWNPVAVFIDGAGVGGGVVDRLNMLGYRQITFEVQWGSSPKDRKRFLNKRVESWFRMKTYIEGGGVDLPDNDDLQRELTSIEYGYTQNDLMRLERKEELMSRGLDSPDLADAYAFTFAEEIWDSDPYDDDFADTTYNTNFKTSIITGY